MLPDSWPLWAQIVVGAGAVCAALTAIGVFLARTGRGVRRATEWIGGIVRREVQDIVDARLAPIAAQFQPNGGESLRDRIDHVAAQQALTAKQLTDHIQASSLDRADLRRWLEHVDPGRTTDRRHPPEETP